MEHKDIRVFLIEDDPEDILLIRETLSEASDGHVQFKLEWSENLKAGLERLAKGHLDVILLDLSLPDSAGLDTFMRTHQKYPTVPIIVLTGLNDKTLGLEALWQGAQDYIVKGRVDGKMLTRVIRYAIERNRMQSELRSESFID